MKNILLLFTAVLFISASSGMEPVSFKTHGDWNDNPAMKERPDGSLEFSKTVSSTRRFLIDPAKKYSLSGEFKVEKGAGILIFGFRNYDSDGNFIQDACVSPVAGSDTTLVAPFEKGDKSILVGDGSRFIRGIVCFAAKPDYSDLPNRNRIGAVSGRAIREGDAWRVKINGSFSESLAAGTPVRAHYGYMPQTPFGTFSPGTEWKKLEEVISGMDQKGPGGKKWRAGTAYAQILIVNAMKKGAVVLMRNVKFEEVPKERKR